MKEKPLTKVQKSLNKQYFNFVKTQLNFEVFYIKYLGLLLLLIAHTLASNNVLGQNNIKGIISGKIIDSITLLPIEYASISLVSINNKKTVNGTTSDSKGNFILKDIDLGNYTIQIYFVGFKNFTLNNIAINKQQLHVLLGEIKLTNFTTKMTEITINADKKLIENKIDKMVYNAEKDLTSQSGVATDILKKVPQVSVDINGNVELQGNSNIRFLINGKPSTIFGSSISDVLQSIPASQIQSIEIITSPGARYDAEGTGGIINIILKKSNAQGINGSLSLSAGTRLENSSINLNARKGKWGINAFFSGNAQLQSTTLNYSDRISLNPLNGEHTVLIQNGSSSFQRKGYQSGINFDFSPNDKNNITASFTYNYADNENGGSNFRRTLLTSNTGSNLSDITNYVQAVSNSHSFNIDFSLNYKKTFKKENQEFDLLYTNSLATSFNYFSQNQQSINPDSIYNGSFGNNPGSEHQTNISANYAYPITKKILFESGLKTVISEVSSQSDMYLLNLASGLYNYSEQQSNYLNYKRQIYAAYISGTFKLKYFDLKTGIREENTHTEASYSNVGYISIKPYTTIVPSGVISKNLVKNQVIKFSYSYRIQRPEARDLNPFVNASDPKNLSTGNPAIKPETANNFELGYNKSFDKGTTINVAVFARINNYDIQSYTNYYTSYKIGDSIYSNVAVSTRENIGLERNFGLNLFVNLPISKKISLRSNIACFERYIYNIFIPGSSINGFNYRFNLNGSYQITTSISMEVFGNFNSPRVTVQGTVPNFTTYNFAIRKLFLNKKGSIAFMATNPFNEYVDQKTALNGTNFILTNLKQFPYRSFGFNFTYKFGRLEFKKEKAIEDPNLTNPQVPGN